MLAPSTSASFQAGTHKGNVRCEVLALRIVVPDAVKADRQELGERCQSWQHTQQDAKQTKTDKNVRYHRRSSPPAFAGAGPRNGFMDQTIAQ